MFKVYISDRKEGEEEYQKDWKGALSACPSIAEEAVPEAGTTPPRISASAAIAFSSVKESWKINKKINGFVLLP